MDIRDHVRWLFFLEKEEVGRCHIRGECEEFSVYKWWSTKSGEDSTLALKPREDNNTKQNRDTNGLKKSTDVPQKLLSKENIFSFYGKNDCKKNLRHDIMKWYKLYEYLYFVTASL